MSFPYAGLDTFRRDQHPGFPVRYHGHSPFSPVATWCPHSNLCLSEVPEGARSDFLSKHIGSQEMPARGRPTWKPAGPG